MPKRKILIVGAGPAGYTAAIYSARAGFDTTILSGPIPGGQLLQTLHIQNYPGYYNQPAPNLVATMHQQCLELSVTLIPTLAQSVALNPLRILDDENTYHTADALIIATGANPKTLNIPGEKELMNFGISTCATCDGHFFRNKDVAVIGGGNTAMEEAIYLSSIAANVHLIHRRDKLRSEHMLQQTLFNLKNIHYHWNSQVTCFAGTKKLTSLILNNSSTLEVAGAFIAIGHIPNTSWCSNTIQCDSSGYIQTYASFHLAGHKSNAIPTQTPRPYTSTPGIFVAGDACDFQYRQAITAAAQGCMASIEAQKWLTQPQFNSC